MENLKKQPFIYLFFLAFLFTVSITGCVRKNNNINNNSIVITTWNLRGYPEKDPASSRWLSQELIQLKPDVLCVQEISNQKAVGIFLLTETNFTTTAFADSSDGQDNAIFCTGSINIEDLPDPAGFQHPAQAAYVSYGGFDAVIVDVHLSWTDVSLREKEKALLKNVVLEMLKKDPDVIITGDFNTEGQDIEDLANSIGLIVFSPAGQEGIGTTYAGHRYDHFLISPDLANEEAVSCHINTFTSDLETAKKVSDHLPVTAIFKTDLKFKDKK
jgi:endonuclease/exonuclease/phosphatase family metal-dependent hydrolase